MATCASLPREVLRNPGFELPFSGCWEGRGCLLDRIEAPTEDKPFDGTWCGKVTQRARPSGSVSQTVSDLDPGKNYYFTVWIRVLGSKEDGGRTLRCMADIQLRNGKQRTLDFATSPYMRPERGWTEVGGDFFLPQGATSVRLYLKFEDIATEYLVSQASLTEVPINPNWKREAEDRIETIRKENVQINVDCGSYDPAHVEVEVSQLRHEFGFGSAVRADLITAEVPRKNEDEPGPKESTMTKYQQIFYENFQWAVFENALKWKQMEWNKDKINFKRVDDALANLRENTITVRGHCIAWDIQKHSPDWLEPMTGAQVLQQVQRRCTYLIGRYKQNIHYWDVNNEQLHHDYFEEKTENVDFMSWMFHKAREQDPTSTLMLNDYALVSSGRGTMAMTSCARYMQSRGTPVHAIGIQSHFQTNVNPHLLMRRLDSLSSARLPLWVTELDIDVESEAEKARSYEAALTVYFSRPEVHGVLLWGFWDQAHWRPRAALWTGPDITPNESGRKWIELVRGKWRTDQLLKPSDRQQTFHIRAFHGTYDVIVKVTGQVVQQQKHVITKGCPAVWDVRLDGWMNGCSLG